MSILLERMTSSSALRAYAWSLGDHLLRHCAAYAAVLGALSIFNSHFAIGVNVTASLPYKLCLIAKGDLEVRRGDLVAFRWHGGGPYPAGVVFTKVVRGVPGDEVT